MRKIMFNDYYGLTEAVLQGRKTMTRRQADVRWAAGDIHDNPVPKYKVGELLAVAQSYKSIHEEMMNGDYGNSRYDAFRCAMVAGTKGWDNKMFVKADLMSHYICITDVRVERLQDISDEDCLKEGIIRRDDMINSQMEDVVRYTFENSFVGGVYKTYATPREAFAALIERPGIGHKGDWSRNNWVFVYTFKLLK